MGYEGNNFKFYMEGYRDGCKETVEKLELGGISVGEPMTLDEFKKQEDMWESLGEPMTQEELDELHQVENEDDIDDKIDELFDEGYSIGHSEGYGEGYSDGFEKGYDEAKAYNVILDGEILDEIYEFKEQILGFRKEPWSENHEHNKMVFELHHSLVALTETWVMNQVWDYWYRRKEELENE